MTKNVLVNGCFDVLHVGHVALLQTARQFCRGGFLVVAIDSDKRVKENKGANRPIFSQDERVRMVRDLDIASYVVVFDDLKELREIAEEYHIDLIVKGAEYQYKDFPEREWNIPITCVPSLNYRTSEIIERIKNAG